MNAEDKAQKIEKPWPKSSARKIIQQRANFPKNSQIFSIQIQRLQQKSKHVLGSPHPHFLYQWLISQLELKKKLSKELKDLAEYLKKKKRKTHQQQIEILT